MPEGRPFVAAVPASSANLGPGFDAIGLALDLWVRATVQPALGFSVSFKAGAYVPTNAGFEGEIVRGMARLLGDARPNVSVLVENAIPLGKGLGASAAGAVLGLTIGAELAAVRPATAELARHAAELEGHPDNALPALLGGVVVAAQPEGADPAYLRFDPPAGLAAVVVTPLFAPTGCAAPLVIDRGSLKTTGAVALKATNDGFIVRTARAADEDRPWSPAPARPWSDRLRATGPPTSETDGP